MSTETLFHLSEEELSLANAKNNNKNKLGFAILLKYFQLENRYPKHTKYIEPLMLNSIANQLNIKSTHIDNFDWEGRSTARYRREIREHLGFKAVSTQEIDKFKAWLLQDIFPHVAKPTEYQEHAYRYFHERQMEPFTSGELERHIHSAHHQFEQQLLSAIYQALPKNTINQMKNLLTNDTEDDDTPDNDMATSNDMRFKYIKKDVPGAKLKHVIFEIQKMEMLNQLKLPEKIINQLSRKVIKKYYLRILAEPPSSIMARQPEICYGLFAIFCYYRSQMIIDNSIDLLTQLGHKMQTSAEQFVNKETLKDIKRVDGKLTILYRLANTSVQYPKGIIQDTIYPQVEKEQLEDLIKELDSKGKWYERQVHKKMRSLYSHAHRRTLLTLLEAFTFNTHRPESQALLEALTIIKKYRHLQDKYYPTTLNIPIEHVVPHEWHDQVVDSEETEESNKAKKKSKSIKVNRINYEIAVLEVLCTQLNCKMIWVTGAYRYGDPDKECPQDFEDNREYYYNLLGLPLQASEFTSPRKTKLHNSLNALNTNIPTNNKVKILNEKGGRIKLSPSEPQAEPALIQKLHRTIQQDWPIIHLLDILKETELQIEFSKQFHTVASRKNLTQDALIHRLLLCLYAIGTNTGLKPISAANADVNYSDLRYVKRRFITVENVRAAIVEVVNKILDIRDPRIWGTATTGVACDSKKISVWDQNLMVQWHTRYRGRGVMVYWHVDAKSLCIYSQLKTCSSSEVGAMIKGVLQHCTNMEIDKAYMDTHGQNTLGFGVSEFLDFDLLPRLSNLNKQKLYYPSKHHKKKYDHLAPILKESINWKLIEDNYDEVVKHMVALKLGMVEPDVLVKQFSSDNYQHPVYQALIEIGKVSKTIFLCNYLMSESLRIEIHESQNIVERVNSIMGFIFYGKLGEISTNLKTDQELAIVCMHLLQACMAYINTLLIQNVLARPEWKDTLNQEDKRALNVLFHAHINPYGLFPLDMKTRLKINNNGMETRKETSAENIDQQLSEKTPDTASVY